MRGKDTFTVKRILLAVVLSVAGLVATGQEVESLPVADEKQANAAEDIVISLLTCAPGEEAYSHYGHTAMRVCQPSQGIDLVYNYGCFDFGAPNFVLRFAMGETDYFLGVCPYEMFEREYMSQGRRVWQQTLNLEADEAQAIKARLAENALRQNCVYRYNFLYANCTTKCRDVIEICCNGTVRWREDNERQTLRDMMHNYNRNHFWARQGIDICLGYGIDQVVTYHEKMFSPMYLMWSAEDAHIGERLLFEPPVLIVNPEHPYESPDDDSTGIIVTVSCLLILLMRIAVARGYVRTHFNYIGRFASPIRTLLDVVVWLLVGLCGLVITSLFFCSEHPSTGTNLLVLAVNPLPLIALCLLKWSRVVWLVRAMLLLTLVAALLFVADMQSIPVIAWFFILYMLTSLADRVKHEHRRRQVRFTID